MRGVDKLKHNLFTDIMVVKLDVIHTFVKGRVFNDEDG